MVVSGSEGYSIGRVSSRPFVNFSCRRGAARATIARAIRAGSLLADVAEFGRRTGLRRRRLAHVGSTPSVRTNSMIVPSPRWRNMADAAASKAVSVAGSNPAWGTNIARA